MCCTWFLILSKLDFTKPPASKRQVRACQPFQGKTAKPSALNDLRRWGGGAQAGCIQACNAVDMGSTPLISRQGLPESHYAAGLHTCKSRFTPVKLRFPVHIPPGPGTDFFPHASAMEMQDCGRGLETSGTTKSVDW